MEIIDFLGYAAAILVGLILGLIGGGGSILTLPILVYLFQIEAVVATGYSLFIIGISSLIGTFFNARENKIEFKIGFLFSIPALSTLYLTRKYFIPVIPDILFTWEDFTLAKSAVIMVLFSVVMLLASYSMIKGRKDENLTLQKTNYLRLAGIGIGVGFLSGMVGAGGGFIIIPALIYFANLPMKKAVATSIFVIAINSLLGFLGDVGNYTIDWVFLGIFSSLAILGIILGIYLTRFISGNQLKKGFGYFVLAMGVFILLREIIF